MTKEHNLLTGSVSEKLAVFAFPLGFFTKA